MMHNKQGRTIYYLECDHCNMQSPTALSKKSALRLARKQGWRIEKRWSGYIHVAHHLCPWCQDDEAKSK